MVYEQRDKQQEQVVNRVLEGVDRRVRPSATVQHEGPLQKPRAKAQGTNQVEHAAHVDHKRQQADREQGKGVEHNVDFGVVLAMGDRQSFRASVKDFDAPPTVLISVRPTSLTSSADATASLFPGSAGSRCGCPNGANVAELGVGG